MDVSKNSNTSVDDLYGDIDDMYVSQSSNVPVTDSDTSQITSSTLCTTEHPPSSTTINTTYSLPDIPSGSYHAELSHDNHMGTDITETRQNGSHTDHTDDDFNLYDEAIVEEHQTKTDSYNDLKTQCELLMARLSKLETENKTLHMKFDKTEQENLEAKRNIARLLLTTKGELSRKDKEINSLRKQLSDSPGGRRRGRFGSGAAPVGYSSLSSVDSDFDPLCVSSPGVMKPTKPLLPQSGRTSTIADKDRISPLSKHNKDLKIGSSLSLRSGNLNSKKSDELRKTVDNPRLHGESDYSTQDEREVKCDKVDVRNKDRVKHNDRRDSDSERPSDRSYRTDRHKRSDDRSKRSDDRNEKADDRNKNIDVGKSRRSTSDRGRDRESDQRREPSDSNDRKYNERERKSKDSERNSKDRDRNSKDRERKSKDRERNSKSKDSERTSKDPERNSKSKDSERTSKDREGKGKECEQRNKERSKDCEQSSRDRERNERSDKTTRVERQRHWSGDTNRSIVNSERGRSDITSTDITDKTKKTDRTNVKDAEKVESSNTGDRRNSISKKVLSETKCSDKITISKKSLNSKIELIKFNDGEERKRCSSGREREGNNSGDRKSSQDRNKSEDDKKSRSETSDPEGLKHGKSGTNSAVLDLREKLRQKRLKSAGIEVTVSTEKKLEDNSNPPKVFEKEIVKQSSIDTDKPCEPKLPHINDKLKTSGIKSPFDNQNNPKKSLNSSKENFSEDLEFLKNLKSSIHKESAPYLKKSSNIQSTIPVSKSVIDSHPEDFVSDVDCDNFNTGTSSQSETGKHGAVKQAFSDSFVRVNEIDDFEDFGVASKLNKENIHSNLGDKPKNSSTFLQNKAIEATSDKSTNVDGAISKSSYCPDFDSASSKTGEFSSCDNDSDTSDSEHSRSFTGVSSETISSCTSTKMSKSVMEYFQSIDSKKSTSTSSNIHNEPNMSTNDKPSPPNVVDNEIESRNSPADLCSQSCSQESPVDVNSCSAVIKSDADVDSHIKSQKSSLDVESHTSLQKSPIDVDSHTSSQKSPVDVDSHTISQKSPVDVDSHTSSQKFPVDVDSHISSQKSPVDVDSHTSSQKSPVDVNSHTSTQKSPVDVNSHTSSQKSPVDVNSHTSTQKSPVDVNSHTSSQKSPVDVDCHTSLQKFPVDVDSHTSLQNLPIDVKSCKQKSPFDTDPQSIAQESPVDVKINSTSNKSPVDVNPGLNKSPLDTDSSMTSNKLAVNVDSHSSSNKPPAESDSRMILNKSPVERRSMCNVKNCTIKMRHLHPKQPNKPAANHSKTSANDSAMIVPPGVVAESSNSSKNETPETHDKIVNSELPMAAAGSNKDSNVIAEKTFEKARHGLDPMDSVSGAAADLEMAENESEGSFGSNIVSEKTESLGSSDNSDSDIDDTSSVYSDETSTYGSASDSEHSSFDDTDYTSSESDTNESEYMSDFNENNRETAKVNATFDSGNVKPEQEKQGVCTTTENESKKITSEITSNVVETNEKASSGEIRKQIEVKQIIPVSEAGSCLLNSKTGKNDNREEAISVTDSKLDPFEHKNKVDEQFDNSQKDDENNTNNDSSLNDKGNSSSGTMSRAHSRSNMLQQLLHCVQKEVKDRSPEVVNKNKKLAQIYDSKKCETQTVDIEQHVVNETNPKVANENIKSAPIIISSKLDAQNNNVKEMNESMPEVIKTNKRNALIDTSNTLDTQMNTVKEVKDSSANKTKITAETDAINQHIPQSDNMKDLKDKSTEIVMEKKKTAGGSNILDAQTNYVKQVNDKSSKTVNNANKGAEKDSSNKHDISADKRPIINSSDVRDVLTKLLNNISETIPLENDSSTNNENPNTDGFTVHCEDTCHKLFGSPLSMSSHDMSGSDSDSSYSSHSTDCSTCSSYSSYTGSSSESDSDSESMDNENMSVNIPTSNVSKQGITHSESKESVPDTMNEVLPESINTEETDRPDNGQNTKAVKSVRLARSAQKRAASASGSSSNSSVKQPMSNSNVNQPKSNSNVNQPKSNSNVNQPKSNNNVNQPKSNSNVNQPKSNIVVNQPKSNIVVNQPKSKTPLHQKAVLQTTPKNISIIVTDNSSSSTKTTVGSGGKSSTSSTHVSPQTQFSPPMGVSPQTPNPYLIADEIPEFLRSGNDVPPITTPPSGRETPAAVFKASPKKIVNSMTPCSTSISIGVIGSVDNAVLSATKSKSLPGISTDTNRTRNKSSLSIENNLCAESVDNNKPEQSRKITMSAYRNKSKNNSNQANISDIKEVKKTKEPVVKTRSSKTSGSSNNAPKSRSDIENKKEKQSRGNPELEEQVPMLRRSPRKKCSLTQISLTETAKDQKHVPSDKTEEQTHGILFGLLDSPKSLKKKHDMTMKEQSTLKTKSCENESKLDTEPTNKKKVKTKEKLNVSESIFGLQKYKDKSNPKKSDEKMTVKRLVSGKTASKPLHDEKVHKQSEDVNRKPSAGPYRSKSMTIGSRTVDSSEHGLGDKKVVKSYSTNDALIQECKSKTAAIDVVRLPSNDTNSVAKSNRKHPVTQLASPLKRFTIPKLKRKASTSPQEVKKIQEKRRKPLQVMSPVKSPSPICLKRTSDGSWSKTKSKPRALKMSEMDSSSSEDSSEGSSIVNALFGNTSDKNDSKSSDTSKKSEDGSRVKKLHSQSKTVHVSPKKANNSVEMTSSIRKSSAGQVKLTETIEEKVKRTKSPIKSLSIKDSSMSAQKSSMKSFSKKDTRSPIKSLSKKDTSVSAQKQPLFTLDDHTMDRTDYEDMLCLDNCEETFDDDLSSDDDSASATTGASNLDDFTTENSNIEDGEVSSSSESENKNKNNQVTVSKNDQNVKITNSNTECEDVFGIPTNKTSKPKIVSLLDLKFDSKKFCKGRDEKRRIRDRSPRSPSFRRRALHRSRSRSPRDRSPRDYRRSSRPSYDRDRRLSRNDTKYSSRDRVRTSNKRHRSRSRSRDSDSYRSRKRTTYARS